MESITGTSDPATPSPEALVALLAERINAADIDALLALYEPTAVFEHQPGAVAEGHTAIRAVFTSLLALRPRMTTRIVQVLCTGDLALVVSDWELTGTLPGGGELRRGGRSSDVVRRQPDGGWLVLIDRP
jgi:uncharacterized protein (TIGR02246 family)